MQKRCFVASAPYSRAIHGMVLLLFLSPAQLIQPRLRPPGIQAVNAGRDRLPEEVAGGVRFAEPQMDFAQSIMRGQHPNRIRFPVKINFEQLLTLCQIA